MLIDLNAGVMNAYRVDSIPTTVLINQSGEIVYFHLGYKPGDEEKLMKSINALFEE